MVRFGEIFTGILSYQTSLRENLDFSKIKNASESQKVIRSDIFSLRKNLLSVFTLIQTASSYLHNTAPRILFY